MNGERGMVTIAKRKRITTVSQQTTLRMTISVNKIVDKHTCARSHFVQCDERLERECNQNIKKKKYKKATKKRTAWNPYVMQRENYKSLS